jgi:gluconate kinase
VSEAWLVTGIPGAGKTTIARALAAKLPRSAHIEGDVVAEMVRGGYVQPGSPPIEEESRQLALAVLNQAILARSFANAGFVPVMDFVVVTRARLAAYRGVLAGLTLRLVVLAPSREAALSRDMQRVEKTVGDRFVHLESDLRTELQGVGVWVDSSALSVDETVAEVLRRASESVVNGAVD